MRNILLLLLLLVIWIVGGTWYHHQCCCFPNETGIPTTMTSTKGLHLQDGTYFEASAPSDVVFEPQSATYTMTEATGLAFAKTATYLNTHPTKVLHLETDTTDLSEQRAMALTRYLVEKQQANAAQLAITPKADQTWGYRFASLKPLVVEGSSKPMECLDNFVFEEANFELAVPLSEELDDFLKRIAQTLKEDPTQRLDIVGSYHKDEENTSSATDLGKARANQIRSLLLEKYGIAPERLGYRGRADKDLSLTRHQNFQSALLIGPIDFVFSHQESDNKTDATAERLKQLEKDLLVTPRRLYFETGKNKLLIDDAFRTYFGDVIFYLENTPTAFIECSGHTDNQGAATNNLKLAQERADFVAGYFSKQGIPSRKIKTVALGEQQPIQSNATASGRAKNRRVEILVKQP